MTVLRVERSLAGLLLLGLLLVLAGRSTSLAQPPGKDDPPEEPKKLNDLIEKSVNGYDVLPEEGAAALAPVAVIRWRNAARGQDARGAR